MEKKALIVGIDGVPYPLLQELIEKGHMPGIAGILKDGHKLHRMYATLPDLSCVSWTSFMTGANPGAHGIFGFTHLAPSTYTLTFPTSRDIKVPKFWRILRLQGKIKKTAALNIPNTYPAFPIDGLLVTGFVSVEYDKSVYPPSYLPYLKERHYVIDVDASVAHKDPPKFYDSLVKNVEKREEVFCELFDKEPWDIFIAIITETDRLHHFFFDKKESDLFTHLYRKVDTAVTSLYKAARKKWGENFFFMMLSDHGFAPLTKEFNINAYLQRVGLLNIDETKQFYDRIGGGSIAFTLDPGRVYINFKGKYPRGVVEPSAMKETRKKLKEVLFGFKDENGERVLQYVFEKEELYRGPQLELAPDLLCVGRRGYDLKGNMQKKDNLSLTPTFKGMHTWDNAILVIPENVKIDGQFTIELPAKLIMQYFS
jgi:predicted AlkP superfamily phosphohydrolase/phosphomutase